MSERHDPTAPAVRRSGPEERDYLLARAEKHRRLAEQAGMDGPKRVHLRLQRLYQERAARVDMVDHD